MGVCYTLILLDEFDWAYVGTNKQKKLEEFANEYGSDVLTAQWYGAAVFDVDKKVPYTKERIVLINKYSDNAYYIADNELYEIKKIECYEQASPPSVYPNT